MQNKPTLFTVLTPGVLNLYTVANSIVVIIDVFRATSTIATALYNGAARVIPVPSVARCMELGKATANSVTAGERDGKIVEGLEHGNSPAEYPREFIKGKTLILTTTNGTRLLHKALEQNASEIITGSFINLSAVCNYLLAQNKNVILGCSAWKDRVNVEDTLFAGAVINRIKDHFIVNCDSSLIAESIYKCHEHDIPGFVKRANHWQRLSAQGLENDMLYCITNDAANILPIYNHGALTVHNF